MTTVATMEPAGRTGRLCNLAIAIATATILFLAPLTFVTTRALWPRWMAIMLLAWWLPGALLVALWRPPKLSPEAVPGLDLPTAGVLAAGLGLCWMILLALLVHWLPGPMKLWPLVATYEIGALVLLLALLEQIRRSRGEVTSPLQPAATRHGRGYLAPTVPVSTWGWVVALLLLALVLRLPGIGYHELHEDEVHILNQAARAIEGVDDVLARHVKGPGEIAVAAVVYRALGTANEITTRLPFGLMGVISVLTTALLGRRLFSPAAGFWAGLLFAVNGFAVGLSRIVQYQPAVLLFSALAVLAAWEFAQRGEGRWLSLAATYSAFGIVMHYEFALLAPVLLVLTWMGWRRTSDKRSALFAALAAGAAGTIIVAATHLPIFLGSPFATTQTYLSNRLGGLAVFNLPILVEMGTFYNSSYFFFGLVLLTLVGLVLGWRMARWRAQSLLLTLWFVPFLILHLFVIQYPGTHFYLLMESWSLLAALPLAVVASRELGGETPPLLPRCAVPKPFRGAVPKPFRGAVPKPFRGAVPKPSRGAVPKPFRVGVLALVCIWLAISIGYLYLVFFQQTPEYLANYGEARMPLYWTPYGENAPPKLRYGFPIQQGWKAVGMLAEWGCLGKVYASNERSPSLGQWYLPTIRRLWYHRLPGFIFVASNLQKPDPEYNNDCLEGYQQVGEIRVRDEPRIEIWAREPLPVSYVTYHAEEFADIFDSTLPVLDDWPVPPLQAQGLVLGDMITLESTNLAGSKLSPGDILQLLLVWRPQQPLRQDYKIFVHLADESGHPLAQWDGMPCLNMGRTSRWVVGEAVEDHVIMVIPEDVPQGEYSLLVGLYDGLNGERLGGQAVKIATITIR